MNPRARFYTIIALLLTFLFAATIWLTAWLSQPRLKPMARAGGDVASHPPKLILDRAPQ